MDADDLGERVLWRLDAIAGLLVLALAFLAFDLSAAYLLPGLLLVGLAVAFLGSRRVDA